MFVEELHSLIDIVDVSGLSRTSSVQFLTSELQVSSFFRTNPSSQSDTEPLLCLNLLFENAFENELLSQPVLFPPPCLLPFSFSSPELRDVLERADDKLLT